MVSWSQLLVFVPAAALVAISPGANNLLAMQHGMRFGVTEAVFALAGRLAAFLVMLGLAVAGLAVVLSRSQAVFEVVKWLGVAYLAYVGVRTLTEGASRKDRMAEPSARVAGRLLLARREFFTVAANPKALLLFTAFLPQFIDPAGSVSGQLVVLGPIYIALELMAATVWALFGHRLHLAELGARARRRLDRAVGAIFLGLAGLLATAKR